MNPLPVPISGGNRLAAITTVGRYISNVAMKSPIEVTMVNNAVIDPAINDPAVIVTHHHDSFVVVVFAVSGRRWLSKRRKRREY